MGTQPQKSSCLGFRRLLGEEKGKAGEGKSHLTQAFIHLLRLGCTEGYRVVSTAAVVLGDVDDDGDEETETGTGVERLVGVLLSVIVVADEPTAGEGRPVDCCDAKLLAEVGVFVAVVM